MNSIRWPEDLHYLTFHTGLWEIVRHGVYQKSFQFLTDRTYEMAAESQYPELEVIKKRYFLHQIHQEYYEAQYF